MAINLSANYAKKLGLPGYSSHSFSASVETELTDLGQVQGEVTRLYSLLQDAVDREIQTVGFVPDEVYGMETSANPDHHSNPQPAERSAPWKCSDKQKEFILKLVEEHDLDRPAVERLAIERFGHGVRQLNKLEASGLIEELLETHGAGARKSNGNGGNRRQPANRKGAARS
jgi:hypothetical protein